MNAGEAIPIASLLATIGVLFGLLIRSLEKRAQDAIERAIAAEAGESAARDRAEATWQKAAEMLHAANEKLATITQAMIDLRQSTRDRT